LADLKGKGLADAFNLGEGAALDQFSHRRIQRFDDPGPLGIGLDLKRVLSGQLQEQGHFIEDFSDVLIVHEEEFFSAGIGNILS
jgi:hypothetical protein